MTKGGIKTTKSKEKKKLENDKKAAVGRTIATKKEKAKEFAYDFEQTNNRSLVVFYSGEGWWKMGGNSALFYAHLVAPRLSIKASLKPDRDFYFKFIDGIVSIKDFSGLKRNLKTMKILPKEETELWTIFDLGFKVSKAELDNIHNIREDRINQVNQIVQAKKLYPSIAALGRKIAKALYTKANHATPVDREIIMNRLTQIAFENVVQIYLISTETLPPVETLQTVVKRNEKLKAYLMLMMEITAFEPEDILALEADLVDMNTQIKTELKKLGADEK